MNVFVFQSVPERYDLRKVIDQGSKDTWYATRYRNKMNPGDIVLFWMAGDEHFRGLYGWGEIVSHPYIKNEWDSHGVDVVYKGRFDKPVMATSLKKDSELSTMLIFRAPQATNFLLNDREVKKLEKFLKKKGINIPSLKEGCNE